MIQWVRAALVLSVLLFIPGLREDFEAPKAAAVRICGWAALATCLASRRTLTSLRWSPLDRVVAAWVATELLATVVSIAPLLSVFGEPVQREGLVTSLAVAGLYLAARVSTPAAPDDGGFGRTLDAFLAAATFAAAYALLQAARLDPLDWSPAVVGGWPSAEGRPFATLGHANLLGVVSAAATAGLWMRAVSERRWVWLRAGAGAICATATLVTLSRGAWIGLAAGLAAPAILAFATGMKPSRRSLLLGAAVLVVVAGVMIATGWGESFRVRFGELLDPARGSGAARLEIWRSALAAWVARPVFGWGPDTFALVFPRFQTPEFWRQEWAALPLHAHSIPLHALATRGALGFACGAVWFGTLLATVLGSWRRAPQARPRVAVLLGMLAAALACGAFGAIGVTGHVLVAVLSGMLAAQVTQVEAAPRPPALTRAGGVAALVAALLAVTELESSRQVAVAQDWLARSADADPRAATLAAERALRALRGAGRLAPTDDFVPRLEVDAQLVRALAAADPRPALLDATGAARRSLSWVEPRVENHIQLARVLAHRVAAGDVASRREAEGELERTVRLAPANALILNECARMELLIGANARALEITRRATGLYPTDGATLLMRARAEARSGNPRAAVTTLRRAVTSEWHGDLRSRDQARAWLALEDTTLDLPPGSR